MCLREIQRKGRGILRGKVGRLWMRFWKPEPVREAMIYRGERGSRWCNPGSNGQIKTWRPLLCGQFGATEKGSVNIRRWEIALARRATSSTPKHIADDHEPVESAHCYGDEISVRKADPPTRPVLTAKNEAPHSVFVLHAVGWM